MAADVAGGDGARMARLLAGVRAYQTNDYRRVLPPVPTIAAAGSARLLDYGGTGPTVVFVPSLINPPLVLDLSVGNSMLRWLTQHGCRVMLVDWGRPDDPALDIGGHVTDRLLPLLAAVGVPHAIAGYCLGGTLAIAAAGLVPVTKLVLLATPWHFSAYGREVTDFWKRCRGTARTLGALPMELLQPMFWQLDPDAAVAKYEHFASLDPDSAEARAFVALEDWANDGAPLALAAARELFEDFYGADLPSLGWTVGGKVADPDQLDIPVLNVVSTRDRIVPSAAAPRVGRRREVDAGHVGMIVGSRGRALVWEPLRDFLVCR